MKIETFKKKDKYRFIELCKEFYNSDSTLRPFSEKSAILTFERVLERHENLWGYMFVDKTTGEDVGYALVSSYWCNEEGGNIIVLDELYISPKSRHNGYGSYFFDWLINNGKKFAKAITLEVLTTNLSAQSLYIKEGLMPDGFVTYTKELK